MGTESDLTGSQVNPFPQARQGRPVHPVPLHPQKILHLPEGPASTPGPMDNHIGLLAGWGDFRSTDNGHQPGKAH